MSDLTKKAIRIFKKIKHRYDRNLVLSFGENCLTDDILNRNDIKAFSTPYSSGRSNIEYILLHEKELLVDLLNPAYLEYGYAGSKKVVRNNKYVKTDNQYHESSTNGFEFTHHDVLGNKRALDSMKRKCKRMLKLKGRNLVVLYHHRMCEETDIKQLASTCLELKAIYESRGNKVTIFAFSQNIIHDSGLRGVVCQDICGVKYYTFNTLNEWSGDNQDIFWARCDDDLLMEMINDIKCSMKQGKK